MASLSQDAFAREFCDLKQVPLSRCLESFQMGILSLMKDFGSGRKAHNPNLFLMLLRLIVILRLLIGLERQNSRVRS